jgi:hypothetical protein
VAGGEIRQLGGCVHAPRVRAAGYGADGQRAEAGGQVRLDLLLHRGSAEPETLVGGHDGKGLPGEAEDIEGLGDREVGLVRGVDAPALEGRSAGGRRVCRQVGGGECLQVEGGRRRQARGGNLEAAGQVDLARDEHGHQVGHRPARGEDAEGLGPLVGRVPGVAGEVPEPADHLLLDEGADRAATPDVDALVGPLRKHLAGDRHRKRRRGDVAERAGVVGVEEVGGEALAELGQHRAGRGRIDRRPGRAAAAGGEEVPAETGVGDRGHAPPDAVLVEVVEGGAPGLLAEALEGGASGGLVAEGDQLGLGVPAGGGEGVVVVGHRGEG